jgi:hypothetical protein
MNAAGSALDGRSLTCPSPSSTTRHTPSARSTRSTVTNAHAAANQVADWSADKWPPSDEDYAKAWK